MEELIGKEESIKQIEQVIFIIENLFNKHLLGIYLYGSAVLGNLKPNSDLDVLVIVDQELPISIRENLTNQLLVISGKVGCPQKRPLEVTIVNQSDIVPWQFPPKCDYMYGEWLRSEIEAGNKIESCYDPDLTILLWQARKHSIVLNGREIETVIPMISFSDIRKAIKESLPQLIDNLKGDERNVLLTLARMWFTLETEEICTKDFAANWVCSKLPKELRFLMELAKDAYCGKVIDQWNNIEEETILLVNFLNFKIKEKLECLT